MAIRFTGNDNGNIRPETTTGRMGPKLPVLGSESPVPLNVSSDTKMHEPRSEASSGERAAPPVQGDAPVALGIGEKFDRAAYQKGYMRVYMREYRQRKKEGEGK